MSNLVDRQAYLVRRGELIRSIAEVEVQTRIVGEELLHRRHTCESEAGLKEERSRLWDTAASLETELRALDTKWRVEEAEARCQQAASTLGARKETVARVAAGLAEQSRIMREIETMIAPLKRLVRDFNEVSDQLRATMKPLGSAIGQDEVHHICRSLNERHHESRLVSGMLFGTGLWGAGTREDWFATQDRDLESYERMRTNTVLRVVERALITEDEEG